MLEGCRQQVRWTHSIRSAQGAVYRLCVGGFIVGSSIAIALSPAQAQTHGQIQPQTQLQSPAQPQAQAQAQAQLQAQPQSAPPSPVAQNTAITRYDNSFSIFHPERGQRGMVASEQRLASQVGVDILAQGGNAIDAAVGVGFALAVVLPNAGNLGGGGFMLMQTAKATQPVALDFREVAPASASRDMYLDEKDRVVAGKSTQSPYAVGVPGSVAGLVRALQDYGTLSLEQVIAPAIQLAENGFIVSAVLAEQFSLQRTHLGRWPGTREIFFKHKDPSKISCALSDCPLDALTTYRAGERLIQKDLASTLRLIAQHGAAGFYSGPVAQKIVTELNQDGQVFSLKDLQDYRVVVREPVHGTYRGFDVYSMPAPSSGGVHLIQMLNLLERYPLAQYGAGSAQVVHLIAESARLAYADRAEHLGDPDFVKVPQKGLASKKYADELTSKIKPDRATPSAMVKAGQPQAFESDQTTHFSVMDAAGNVVSCTYTLNLNFGSGIVARGTGVLLNNEMDDFSIKPGVPNAFGLIGGDANAIAPGKRPLSSMTPVIISTAEGAVLATGSPGGARIITTVLQNLINIIDFKMNIAEAIAVPRMHHQWVPDYLRLERGFSPDTIALLQKMGHEVRIMPAMGRVQTVQRTGTQFFGASDPRNPDGAAFGIGLSP
jgi:gamma-glutamyltranspeptidase/glutathione hydrolase